MVRGFETHLTALQRDGDATVTDVVDLVIGAGIERRGSDVHLEPLADALAIRFRLDGLLAEMGRPAAASRSHGALVRISALRCGHRTSDRPPPAPPPCRPTQQQAEIGITSPGILRWLMGERRLWRVSD